MPRHAKKLVLMKLMVLLSFVFGFQVSARVSAQKVTLSEHNVPIRSVFAKIEQQTGFSFIYDDPTLKNAVPVTIELKEVPLEEALTAIFKSQPLSFKIFNKTIAVQPKLTLEPVSNGGDHKKNESTPLPITVHGKVVNEKGEPMPGVTVTVKGASNRVSTNDNGEFTISVSDPKSTLVFTAVTIETYETRLNGRTIIPITVTTKTSQLDEVQVIAYGTISKRLNTGNVSTVNSDDINKQPISNPIAALEGKVPGLIITQQTGVPGGGFKVQIRGQNSLRRGELGQIEGNNPFYIIDGLPYPNNSFQQINAANGLTGAASLASPLNYINPSDIESIEVLKDADATAIYGSRGANGVILITTKKGKAGKTKIDINIYRGEAKVPRMLDLLNTQQYLQMRREAIKNDGVTPTITDRDLLVWDTTRYIDWQKVLFGGTAKYTDMQASISGGNSHTQFHFGGGFHKETTVFPGDFANSKIASHFNLNHLSENKRFKASFSASYILDNNNLLRNDITGFTYLAPNAPPVYDSTGKLNWPGGYDNPFAQLFQTYKAFSTNLISSCVITYEVFKGLQIKVNSGYNSVLLDEKQLTPIRSLDPLSSPTGSHNFGTNKLTSWIVEPQGLYNVRLGQSNLQFLVGSTFQENRQESLLQSAIGYTSDNLIDNISLAPSSSVQTNIVTNYRYNALFGRMSYNYADQFLVNISARRDGSSRFGSGKQFANFGAVGTAWIFSKTQYIQRIFPLLSFGKLRLSYGTTGSDQIGDYQYLSSYSSNYYNYQGSIGLLPSRLYNPDYSWEINRKFEAGLELGFLKDRILFTTSYYRNRSSNQLIGLPLSTVTGFSVIQSNFPAQVQNTGVELLVSTENFKGKDFIWNSSINITIPDSKLVSFPGIENTSYVYTYSVGQAMSIVKSYHFLGVDPQTGVYQFEDYDKDGRVSFPNDKQLIKNIAPRYYGGFQNNFHYKGFELSILLQFVKQDGRITPYNFLPGYSNTNQPNTVLNRWQNPGDITNIQRFTRGFGLYPSYSNATQSDQFISDASFVRLRNLSLSYQFPSNWKQKLHLQDCRVYVQGQNLFTITNYKGNDPETQSNSALPILRVLTAGIQFNL